ncbi:MAG: STAS domain-containing protein [Lachnospiraceae bacterium]|nr:STAS domain-containing protein [Lachnospiraceae bacterium]
MLKITSKVEGEKALISLKGKLDTNSAHDFNDELMPVLDAVKELVLDFENLEYISSAGLRVLLVVIKKMNEVGSMKVLHVNENVMDVLNMTGISDDLVIE